MNKITLEEKSQIAKELLEDIKALHKEGETVRLMEVCGTHTVAIFREGIRQVLPKGIELVSGPGCPVCVTDQVYMDKALAYAAMDNVIIATFGDMLKVPGTHSNLWEAKSKGAQIHIIYSPLEIIELGKAHPDKMIVFLAIGFETTIAVIAAAVKAVAMSGVTNVFFLVSHKLVPPALRALANQEESRLDGFILPGHVSVIIGEEPYQFLPAECKMPSCIAGFDGLEILAAIRDILQQRKSGQYYVGNQYKSVVAKTGNPVAVALMHELYEPIDDTWRGIGTIPNSGLRLKGEYAKYDVEQMIPLGPIESGGAPKGCQCGRVLQGLIRPDECGLFGTLCTADHPVGACMVSVEGSCAAWYKYGRSSGGLTWEE
ncbi:hydrogenase formation protein HypD [uncultured Veillonella sp.]|uniref:hydrogenase formation protein HypD n=1 Tax=uncultured Veillonella sp. TaxID=159268 RepID=UPI002634B61A|nr:hydrogenase formation protein HypD [uncultured Veillonella sp.]